MAASPTLRCSVCVDVLSHGKSSRSGFKGTDGALNQPDLSWVGQIDGFDLPHDRAHQLHFAPTVGTCPALDDTQLQTVLDPKPLQKRERHGAKGVHAHRRLVVCDALESDADGRLCKRHDAKEPLDEPANPTRLAAVVLQPRSANDDAWLVPAFTFFGTRHRHVIAKRKESASVRLRLRLRVSECLRVWM